MPVNAELERNFSYHPPKIDHAEKCSQVMDAAKKLAYIISELAPMAGRERSLAFTKLEETCQWACLAIARSR